MLSKSICSALSFEEHLKREIRNHISAPCCDDDDDDGDGDDDDDGGASPKGGRQDKPLGETWEAAKEKASGRRIKHFVDGLNMKHFVFTRVPKTGSRQGLGFLSKAEKSRQRKVQGKSWSKLED